MASAHTSILLCGLKENPRNVVGGPSATASKAIFADIKRLQEEGFHVETILVDPHADVESNVNNLKKAISTRPHWDGASVGFGVRGNGELTPLFEHLVNTIITEVQPPPKMIFTEWVDKVYVSVRRAFPKEA